ncbi:MAG: toprim domain-containing protein [Deltaproteobacteria bacterium]|nr:toprim domain-containing protein [Deltaproteobacteria bacterium]
MIELVRRIEGCTYAQAGLHLQRLAGRDCPLPPVRDGHRQISAEIQPGALADEPGFRPFRSTIPLDPCCPFLQQAKAITPATATAFEAGLPDQRSAFLRGTVAVRLHDLQGNPLGYCERRLEPTEIQRYGKWKFPRSFPKAGTLYNAHRALSVRQHGLVIVECPWAVMRLAQAGIRAAVALLGTTVSPVQADWLARASAVLLLLDGDHAGRKAAPFIAGALAPTTKVHVHELPDGLEPEDLPDHDLRAIVMGYLPFSLNQYALQRGDR